MRLRLHKLVKATAPTGGDQQGTRCPTDRNVKYSGTSYRKCIMFWPVIPLDLAKSIYGTGEDAESQFL